VRLLSYFSDVDIQTLRQLHEHALNPASASSATEADEKASAPSVGLPEVQSQIEAIPSSSNSEATVPDSRAPGFRSLMVPRVMYPLLNYAFIAFVDQCYEVLQPLMYSTSIGAKGLGFSTLTIGIVMGVWGVINCIVEIFIFPPLVHKVGARKLYIVSFACYLVCLSAFPLMAFLAQRAGRVDVWTWIVLVMQLAVYTVAFMGYGELPILPSPPKATFSCLYRMRLLVCQYRGTAWSPGCRQWPGADHRLHDACDRAIGRFIAVRCLNRTQPSGRDVGLLGFVRGSACRHLYLPPAPEEHGIPRLACPPPILDRPTPTATVMTVGCRV
jgi:hypothetical protein